MDEEKVRWSQTGRKIVKTIVAVVVVIVVVSLITLPIFDRTRDARYEVVSMSQETWITRGADFETSSYQESRSGFWCSYYVWRVLNLTETEGTGGSFQVHFENSPEGYTSDVTVYASAHETETVSSGELCASSASSTVSYTVVPPRITEKYRGIDGTNPVCELRGELTLRELEGITGEYVVRFSVQPGPLDSRTYTQHIVPGDVRDFDVSFSVPSCTGHSISYSINAPKVRENASLITILFG
ncbi:MAG TPA: hypothetical protein VJ400_07880 [Thermoplasmata archaeon]|nr:hypothetical protein [Thermoplasmata archaeon]